MAIVAYVGLPGSGKTYTAVGQVILPALKQGRTVVTNLPMKADLVASEIRSGVLRSLDLTVLATEPERIFDFAPNGCVLVLDEVWRLFPAGQKVNQVPEPYKTLLAEHRHRVDAGGHSMEIVLVCQDLAQISSFARQLVETTYRCTKLTALGLQKRFRTDIFHGPMAGPNPPISQRLREVQGRYSPQVYRYYLSHQYSEAANEGADERATDRRTNVLMRPLMLAAPLVIGGLVWFGLHHFGARHAQLAQAGREAAEGGSRKPLPAGYAISGPIGAYSSVPAGQVAAPVVWHTAAVLRGLGGSVGDFVVMESSDGAIFWEAYRLCLHLPFGLACPMAGKYWDANAYSYPGVSKPLAAR